MSERDPKTGRFPPSVWGGAKGSGSKRETLPLIGADREQPSPEAKREGQARRRERLQRIAEAHDAAMDKLLSQIEGGGVEPRDLNAIVRDTGNRLFGMPKQPMEHSHRPAEQMSDDELAAIAAGGGPAAPAAESDTPIADQLG